MKTSSSTTTIATAPTTPLSSDAGSVVGNNHCPPAGFVVGPSDSQDSGIIRRMVTPPSKRHQHVVEMEVEQPQHHLESQANISQVSLTTL
jgi:hypothetical protein